MSNFLSSLAEYAWVWTIFAFILGAIVGSFLNVCISRLPLQKSVLWPGSRCGSCLQPVRWYDNIPLFSYWRLGGKCRSCGASFSARYFWIEFLTGAIFAGLFWLEVVANVRQVALLPLPNAPAPAAWDLLFIWIYHAVFFSLLIVCTFTDADYQEIPLGITITGTIIGIVGGALAPWPWPLSAAEIDRIFPGWQDLHLGRLVMREAMLLPSGLQHWPFWIFPTDVFPPDAYPWLQPGHWFMGLATGVIGAAVGAGMFRLIRWVFGWALEKEAMGLGDADLMMMIGAFLGWQALLLVLMFAVGLGLLYAISLVVRNKGNELPFGPFLAAGAVLTTLFSVWWGPILQPFFFDLPLILGLCLVTAVLGLFMTMAIRMIRLIGQAA